MKEAFFWFGLVIILAYVRARIWNNERERFKNELVDEIKNNQNESNQ